MRIGSWYQCIFVVMYSSVFAATYNVTLPTDSATTTGGAPGELRYVLNQILEDQANGAADTRDIMISVGSIQLNATLPIINLFRPDTVNINISGTPVTIDGNGSRIFFCRQGNINLYNLTLMNGVAIGGTGSGGGAGLGGALFVHEATVQLYQVSFTNNQGFGGTGSFVNMNINATNSGGGGLKGDGGLGFGGGGGYSGNGGSSDDGKTCCGGGGLGDGGGAVAMFDPGFGGGGGAVLGTNGGSTNTSPTAIGSFGGGGGATTVASAGAGASPGAGGGNEGGGGGGGICGGGGGGGGGIDTVTMGGDATSGVAGIGGNGGDGQGGTGSTLGGMGGSSASLLGSGGGGGGGGGTVGGVHASSGSPGAGFGLGGNGGGLAGGISHITGGAGGGGGIGGGGGGGIGGGGEGGIGGGGGGGAGGEDVNLTESRGSPGGNGGYGGGGGCGFSEGNGGFGGGGGFTLSLITNFPTNVLGGLGGFGGGGGACVAVLGNATGGTGGFGGGGGWALPVGGATGTPGTGGVGGGQSSTMQGGGGAGLGGAIFLHSSGTINYVSSATLSGGNVTAGNGGNPGAAAGKGIFLMHASTLNFAVPSSQTITIADSIADDSDFSLPGPSSSYTPGNPTDKGNITKTGLGTLVLSGDNTFIGISHVNQGDLFLTGSLASDINIAADGILRGTGTIHRTTSSPATVDSYGTIAPGGSTAVLTMDKLTLESDGFLDVTIDPPGIVDQASLIHITDASLSTLGGTLRITRNPGIYPLTNPQYLIINAASSPGGSFSNIVDTDPSFPYPYRVLYNGNQIFLTYGFSIPSSSPIFSQFSGMSFANTQLAITAIRLNSHWNRLRQVIQRTTEQRNKSENNTLLTERDDLEEPKIERSFIAKNSHETYPTLRVELFETAINNREVPSSFDDFKSFGEGALLAWDRYNLHRAQGLLAGYLRNDLYVTHNNSHSSSNTALLGVYEMLYYKHGYLEIACLGAWNQIHNTRSNTSVAAISSGNAYQVIPHLNLGLSYWGKHFAVEPYITADYGAVWTQGLKETKSTALFQIQQPFFSLLRGETGVSIYQAWESEDTTFVIEEQVAYVTMRTFNDGKITGIPLLIGGSNVTVSTLADQQNLLLFGMELSWKQKNGRCFCLMYNGEWNPDYFANTGKITLGKYF